MEENPISPELRRFIESNIQSVEHLEILCLLAEDASRSWSIAEAYRYILSTEKSVAEGLQYFCDRGFFSMDARGKFRFTPNTSDWSFPKPTGSGALRSSNPFIRNPAFRAALRRPLPAEIGVWNLELFNPDPRGGPWIVFSFDLMAVSSRLTHPVSALKNVRHNSFMRKSVFRFWLLFSTLAAMLSICPAATARELSRVVAWGDINYDLTNNVAAPGRSVARIAAGDFHSLVLQRDGLLLAWGDDRFGQSSVPSILNRHKVVKIAAGNVHNLALLGNGTVAAWGPPDGAYGDYGQDAVPAGLNKVKAIAAGSVHSLALRRDGTVVAWGFDDYGQCDVPAGLNNVVAIAGGMYHSLALKRDGTVVAWGDDNLGQSTVPKGLNHVVAIAAGGFHNLALKSDGTVVSWGGYGLSQVDVPSDLGKVVAIATGDYHSLALRRDGTIVAWGLNTFGQCDIPPGLKNVCAIAAHGRHSMALLKTTAK
jgi:Regulator of chromosome condensation (RCC1) repeat